MTKRRGVLRYLGVGIGALIAGCTGGPNDGGESPTPSPTPTASPTRTSSPTETNSPTPTETDSPTPSPTPSPSLELVESSIYLGPEDRNWIRSVVRNTSDATHGRLNVNYTIRADDGSIVDSQTGLIDLVPPGEWLNYRLVLGSQREQASTVEASLRQDSDPRAAPQLEAISFDNTRLSKDYQSATEITGEVTNNGEARSIYIVGLVYTDDSTLRGSVGEVVNELGSGETRAFRAVIAKHRTPEDRPEALPTSHEMYAFQGVP